jgi:hypothetical protein
MLPVPENRTPRCEIRWIGGGVVVLGGASLVVTGLDSPLAVLMRLGIAALAGFVLSFLFCPARARRKKDDGTVGDGSSSCDDPRPGGRGDRADGDSGRDDDAGNGAGDGAGDGGTGGSSDGGGGDGGGGDGGGGE